MCYVVYTGLSLRDPAAFAPRVLGFKGVLFKLIKTKLLCSSLQVKTVTLGSRLGGSIYITAPILNAFCLFFPGRFLRLRVRGSDLGFPCRAKHSSSLALSGFSRQGSSE